MIRHSRLVREDVNVSRFETLLAGRTGHECSRFSLVIRLARQDMKVNRSGLMVRLRWFGFPVSSKVAGYDFVLWLCL